MMRKRSKYKMTVLSTLFIEAFFLVLGRVAEPIPVARLLVDIFAETV